MQSTTRSLLSILVLCCVLSPGTQQTSPKSLSQSCAPPYETRAYTKPPDDSVVFDSLLEASGWGSGSNSDWVDVAAGNFCGALEKELVLIKNRHSNLSILRGPAPFPVGTGDIASDPNHPWRAVAAANLDGGPYDEIVAVRKVAASGVPDLVVFKANGSSCDVTTVVASTTIGNPSNSEWLDAAVGNFDSTGTKQIALLKAAHSNFFLVKFSPPNTLAVTQAVDLDTNPSQPWKAIAAGDIDGDGVDELIAARQVSDSRGATVLVYKLTPSGFRLFATSTVGNNGNSNWSSAAVGDFNGDGRKSIVLVKNQHSNFIVLDLPNGATQLRTMAAADLDSAAGQNWRGLVATDWLGGDQGASELIAVRAAHDPYRTDLFVYGNSFHRISRDTGLERTKAQWDQSEITALIAQGKLTINDFKDFLRDTHTNTVNWVFTQPVDYPNFVDFLNETKDFCVDGKQLRVWATLYPPSAMTRDVCSLPADSPLTRGWNELDFFKKDHGVFAGCSKKNAGAEIVCDYCRDYLGWASLFGRLARDYPHLVALGIDDFSHHVDSFPDEYIAELESRLRSQAPWLNFVPTVYYTDLSGRKLPDVALTFDTMLFYFRNEQQGACLAGPCGEASIANAHNEYAEISKLLPAGRKLQAGIYYGQHSTLGEPTTRYDYDLTNMVLNLPWLGGATAYPMQIRKPGLTCTEFNSLDDKYCVLQRAFGRGPQYVTHLDLTDASGAPLAAGDPFGFVYDAQGVQNVIFRATDAQVHELWRRAASIGHSNLSALGKAPPVIGDPKAYVFGDLQNVVYHGADGHLHELYWSTGAVGHDDLTLLSKAPGPAGDPSPYVAPTYGIQNIVYRGTDGHIHGLFWSTGAVGHDDLTRDAQAPAPIGDPTTYFIAADGTHHVIYRSGEGHLHELWWTTGAVGHGDLTILSHTPPTAGDPTAYFAPTYGLQNVVYCGTDGHLHGLYWTTGPVGHDDLTTASHGPAPVGKPAAYFDAADGTHHVIYRSANGRLHELTWTTGMVTHNDLTVLGSAPFASGNPSAYLISADGTHHVIYRTADGHLHELRWSK